MFLNSTEIIKNVKDQLVLDAPAFYIEEYTGMNSPRVYFII